MSSRFDIYTQKQNDAFEFLDGLNLEPYLVEWANIYDIMQKIEKDFGSEFYDKVIFNYISIEDFLSYLYRRYGDKFYFVEHTEYTVHRKE